MSTNILATKAAHYTLESISIEGTRTCENWGGGEGNQDFVEHWHPRSARGMKQWGGLRSACEYIVKDRGGDFQDCRISWARITVSRALWVYDAANDCYTLRRDIRTSQQLVPGKLIADLWAQEEAA